jgi:hypothetical protein
MRARAWSVSRPGQCYVERAHPAGAKAEVNKHGLLLQRRPPFLTRRRDGGDGSSGGEKGCGIPANESGSADSGMHARNPTAPARSIGQPMLGGQTREAEVEMVEGCRSLSFP